ncbi:MAG: SBBP repeat-containing protein [Verrucomicrobiales bacterium]|nr:SBBP repeat-containing protein [Verrucomicrobiales bacterium]
MMRPFTLLVALGFLFSPLFASAQTPSFRWVQTLGGSAETRLDFLKVDSDGNRYAVGTFSGRFSSGSEIFDSVGDQSNVFIAKTGSGGQTLWARKIVPSDYFSVQDVLVDGNGGLVLTGYFEGRAAFDLSVLNSRGAGDIFLVRYDPTGNVAWVRQAGGVALDVGSALLTDSSHDVYLTGWIGMNPSISMDPMPSIAIFGGGLGGGPLVTLPTVLNTGFLAKFDLTGSLVWAKPVPGGESTLLNFVHGSSEKTIVGELGANSVQVPFDDKGLKPALPFAPISGTPDSEHALLSYEQRPIASVGTLAFGGKIAIGPVQLETSASSWWFMGQDAVFGRSSLTGEITFARKTDRPYTVTSDDAGNFYIYSRIEEGDGRLAKLDPISGNDLWSLETRRATVRAVTPLPDGSLLVGGHGSGTLGLGSFTINTDGNSVVFIARISASPTIDWVRNGGGAIAHASAESVAVDAAGNRFVAGWFRGESSFSGNPQKSVQASTDGFLAKYDKAGNFQWVQPFGGKDFDTARGVAVDRVGNCYVAGEFAGTAAFGANSLVSKGSSDIFLAKYGNDGTLQWVRQAGGPGDEYLGNLTVDPGGNCFVTGSFSQTAIFDATSLTSRGSWDIFLAKFSPSGTQVWVTQAGGTQDDRGFGIVTDPTGNLFLTGFFSAYATFGTIDVNGFGSHDVFLAKYDATGKALWVTKAGGSNLDNAYAVALDASGNAFVTGILRSATDFGGIPITPLGGFDVVVAKFSPAGKCLWAKVFGSTSNDDQAEGIAVDRDGNCYVTGEFRASITFGPYGMTSRGSTDAFLLKLSGISGEVMWAKQIGGTGDDLGYGIAIEGDQNWVWAGMCRGTVAFDQQSVVATAEDFFLANSASVFNPRSVVASDVEGVLGSTVNLPVTLNAQGDENAFAFTVIFDPTALTNVTVLNGDGTRASGLTQLLINRSRIAEGRLGVTAAADPGAAIPAGAQRILTVRATVLAASKATATTVAFGDDILLREIDDAKGQPLTSDFYPGTVSIIRGYEGDVMPPGGDNQVTLADWIKAGRFAAQLDVPAPGDETIRADCSPYLINDVFIGGDGAIGIGDWVQIGRLAAGLDPIRPQGGPGQNNSLPAAPAGLSSPARHAVVAPVPRQIHATPLRLAPGETGEFTIEIAAAGNENATAFSLTLDSGLVEFVGASLTRDTQGGTLVVNPNHLGGGQLGILVALPADTQLAEGTHSLVIIRVKATTTPGPWTNTVEFLDFPVKRQVVEAHALELPATYDGSRITIDSAPAQSPRIAEVRQVNGKLQFMSDGFTTGSVTLETSENLRDWTPITFERSPEGAIIVPLEISASARFYRLLGP